MNVKYGRLFVVTLVIDTAQTPNLCFFFQSALWHGVVTVIVAYTFTAWIEKLKKNFLSW